MKKLIPCIMVFILVFFNTTHAQYQSIFGDTQTSWNIKHEQLFGEYTDSLTVVSDSIINNEVWKKLDYYSYFSSSPALMPQNVYLKEDTSLGKVWYFSSHDTLQKLIADFSLNLNDTFSIGNIGGSVYYPVDSIYYLNGRKHVQLNVYIDSQQTEKFVMIEGVSTNLGITYKETGFTSVNPYLLCQYKDFTISYQNNHPLYLGLCNTITSIDEINFTEKFNIYPNPSNGNFNIIYILPQNKEGKLEIIDLTGKIVYEMRLPQLGTLQQISLPSYISNGIFSAIIRSENSITTKKFILLRE